MADNFLTEKEWSNLLLAIHLRRVIPVVGSGMVTIEDPESQQTITLQKRLAPQLAETLGFEKDVAAEFSTFNEVARAYLVEGGQRQMFYPLLSEMLSTLKIPLPPALLALAEITDFNLFVTSAPDPSLARAVKRVRPDFKPETDVIRYHPSGSGNLLAKDPPPDSKQTYVCHILGDYLSSPDYGIADEDYIEFVCGLLEKRDTLGFPITALRNRNLLLLGTPSDDWIVRFFLRAIRGQRLSFAKEHFGHLIDRRAGLGAPMIFFFDKAVTATRIIDGSPGDFTLELARRWKKAYGITNDPEEFYKRQVAVMPRDSVFISYSRDDQVKAAQVGMALANAGVPVWLDTHRLEPGSDFDLDIESVVKDCSFFVSLISKATEDDAHRYVHKERDWAATRQPKGFVFYLPLILDDTVAPKLEPANLASIHRVKFEALDEFVARVRRLMDEFRVSGRPRS